MRTGTVGYFEYMPGKWFYLKSKSSGLTSDILDGIVMFQGLVEPEFKRYRPAPASHECFNCRQTGCSRRIFPKLNRYKKSYPYTIVNRNLLSLGTSAKCSAYILQLMTEQTVVE